MLYGLGLNCLIFKNINQTKVFEFNPNQKNTVFTTRNTHLKILIKFEFAMRPLFITLQYYLNNDIGNSTRQIMGRMIYMAMVNPKSSKLNLHDY